MILCIVFLIVGCILSVFTEEVSHFVTAGPVDESQKFNNETYNEVELDVTTESQPIIDEDYYADWPSSRYDIIEDYVYEYEMAKESKQFKEEWNIGVVREIHFIGSFDPNSINMGSRVNHIRDNSDQRSVSKHRYKRVPRKGFDMNKGCNRLPEAPDNSMGVCEHTDTIAKCWVKCHRFHRYPDNTRYKTFICLDGLWSPQKLPDCKRVIPPIRCEERAISGRNMNVVCVQDGGIKKCIARCNFGFRFKDRKLEKIIKCENIKGGTMSRTRFEDCAIYPYRQSI